LGKAQYKTVKKPQWSQPRIGWMTGNNVQIGITADGPQWSRPGSAG
jgi:hypothetical protein